MTSTPVTATARTFDPDVDSYFTRDGARYVPTIHGAGPWAPGSISGRPVLGLATHLFEQALPSADWLPARLTVDLMRMAMLEPIEVVVNTRKSGRTAMVIDIELLQSGRPVALARGLGTLAEVAPDTAVWSNPTDIAPVPTHLLPEHPDYPMSLTGSRWVEGQAAFAPGPHGWLSAPAGPPVGWARERGTLIAGERTSAYVRLGLVADVSNSVINVGETGLKFINPDVALYLSRRPVGDHIGLLGLDHLHAGGTSVGSARLYDEQGPVGVVSMTSTHQPHMPTITFNDPTGGAPASSAG